MVPPRKHLSPPVAAPPVAALPVAAPSAHGMWAHARGSGMHVCARVVDVRLLRMVGGIRHWVCVGQHGSEAVI